MSNLSKDIPTERDRGRDFVISSVVAIYRSLLGRVGTYTPEEYKTFLEEAVVDIMNELDTMYQEHQEEEELFEQFCKPFSQKL